MSSRTQTRQGGSGLERSRCGTMGTTWGSHACLAHRAPSGKKGRCKCGLHVVLALPVSCIVVLGTTNPCRDMFGRHHWSCAVDNGGIMTEGRLPTTMARPATPSASTFPRAKTIGMTLSEERWDIPGRWCRLVRSRCVRLHWFHVGQMPSVFAFALDAAAWWGLGRA